MATFPALVERLEAQLGTKKAAGSSGFFYGEVNLTHSIISCGSESAWMLTSSTDDIALYRHFYRRNFW
ncbi:hypothetical protein [Variovorax sp. DXTD-1]|uniref:hypothetical protein n=1 Tax=Variovorax sp. DXTD-1 TaxID=2495592 RepID=UPI000F8884F9|nr:hypothetical protein [Variovorax sp. DXTD-1]RST54008.1 hypothetical protein EJI00_02450 [Variovorax sp. DXTD-1]